MDMEGLSVLCAGLGAIEEDENGSRIGFSKDEYCLDNLKDLLRFLRRDDPQTRDVFKQVCKWNVVSKYLIPIIEYCQDDRSLLLNAVKVLVFLTMPFEPTSTDISQQLEYMWNLKSSITNSDIVAVIVSFLENPLENLERNAFTEDDWKLVQLVLTLFRNFLAIQEIPSHLKSGGFTSQFLSLRDRFLELLFRENVMDIILIISNYTGGSNIYIRQDNLLLLEIFHYIFMGQEPELVVMPHLNGLKVDEESQTSLNSLKSIMEEEKEKRRLCRLGNVSRHSHFSGTFATLTVDGSKAVFKGDPNSASHHRLLKSQNVTCSGAKKIAWDHPRLPSKKDKILELLNGFVSQFLSGGYNVLMQSIREDIEKEHPAIQKSDVVVYFQVADFVTSFQFYKYSASKTKDEVDLLEIFCDKESDSTDFSGKICGPIAATMNESMFQLVFSKWRHAFDGLKETNDYKFLSAAGSLLKNMILMLDLVLKLLPEDSREPQTARILLYKLFYDQTEQGMTQFLLNLMKMFDMHKQPKSDLADLIEIIHKVVKLMEKLQSRGTLRVSRKSRKVRKKFPKEMVAGHKPFGDHSCVENVVGASSGNQLAEVRLSQKECSLNTNSSGQEDIVAPHNDADHEKNVEEDENFQGESAPTDIVNYEPTNEDMLYGADNFSGDEQLTAINEVDFKVSALVSTFANHSIIQRLCWLLKFYKSNSLATNHYIICMLRRISNDLELHPMLYQLSLLTTFYDILVEQKSCPCKEYANIVDFLTNLVRKMLKKMKNQPLLFVEILFWKTRRECHYINAEYLLDELGHLKKESRNWNSTQGDGKVSSSPAKACTYRSIADALGEDEFDVEITHDSGYQNNREKLDDANEGFVFLHDNGERLTEDKSERAPRRRKKLMLDGELERQIKDLFEKFKDDQHCSHRIAEVLHPDGKISPAQISKKLEILGLKVAPRKKMGDVDEDEPLSTSLNQFEVEGTEKGVTNLDKSIHLEGSLFSQHLQKRKRVRAFNEDQEALIRTLYEQFKDHRRCSYMIAKALDVNGKFTSAQVSRKLKQLGISVTQKKNIGGVMQPRDDDHVDSFIERADESDDETLISLMKRKKMENSRLSSEELHEKSIEEELSKDDSDDEMLCSVLKKTRRSLLNLQNDGLETIQIKGTIMDNDSSNKDVLESEISVGLVNSQQVDDELVDSEDDVHPSVYPDNATTRRKLRMVIDPEDDD